MNSIKLIKLSKRHHNYDIWYFPTEANVWKQMFVTTVNHAEIGEQMSHWEFHLHFVIYYIKYL